MRPYMRQHHQQVRCSCAQVLAAMRAELFRVLLLQSVDFYDRTSTAELTGLLSSELDGVRSFIVSNVSRDRGLRAILEASGSVSSTLTAAPLAASSRQST